MSYEIHKVKDWLELKRFLKLQKALSESFSKSFFGKPITPITKAEITDDTVKAIKKALKEIKDANKK